MKHKILIAFIVTILFSLNVFAQELQSDLDNVVNSDKLSKSAVIAIKIIDKKTKEPIYQRESSLLLHPASTMKVVTSALVFEVLGANYNLNTALYESQGKLFLKLCGDPTLVHDDLVELFKNVDLTKYDTLVVDNTFIDNEFYDDGWMWDNLVSTDNPPYGIFNLDRNLTPLKIVPNKKTGMVQIISSYPVEIGNELKIGKTNNVKIQKRPWQNPNAIYISGEVCSAFERTVPVQNPEQYFLHYLHKSMPDFSGKIFYGELPCDSRLLSCKQTKFMDILCEQNKKSNNLFAETMFKIAAREAYGIQGNMDLARKLFEKFYGMTEFVIADASGLSHNNLINCDFLCEVLYKMSDKPEFCSTLSSSGKDGTLKKRLKEVSLQGKTGTISGVSGLCGYIKTQKGHEYIFAVLIQNYKGSSRPAKALEDKIIRKLNEF